MKIGIPRAMFYYLNGDITVVFFKKLGIDVVISPKTESTTISSKDDIKYEPSHIYVGRHL